MSSPRHALQHPFSAPLDTDELAAIRRELAYLEARAQALRAALDGTPPQEAAWQEWVALGWPSP